MTVSNPDGLHGVTLTIEEGCDDEFTVLLHQVVDVAKDSTGSCE